MLARDIALYYDGLGYVNFYESGFNENNNCFINNLPEEPNNCVAIYDTGGDGNVIGFPEYRRSIQILIRNETVFNGSYLAWVLYEAIIKTATNGFLNEGGRKMLIRSKNTPTFIGKDSNGLFEWSFNISVWSNSDLLNY